VRPRSGIASALVLATSVGILAQAPDGNAVLRGAGVDLPRRGAEEAFELGLQGVGPVPPGAFATLIIGMGPVGAAPRMRAAYAFGVLAGRSARAVPPSELAGAGVALQQMLVADERRVRIAGARVSGRVFAAPIDGKPAPTRPAGLEAALIGMLNQSNDDEQEAAIEALGLLKEIAVQPVLVERYQAERKQNHREAAGTILEALVRIGDPSTDSIVRALAGDQWGDRDDRTGLVVAYARERYLKDGSVGRLQAAASDKRLGPAARAYLAELGVPQP
jgi:hypothetical protein